MVTNTFLMHLTSTTGGTNWTAAGIVAPPTTFNAHLRLTPAGEYVLFFRNSGGKLPPTNWETLVCNGGISDAEWAALVAKGPYISADKLTDSVGNFVAKTHNMLSGAGGWRQRKNTGWGLNCIYLVSWPTEYVCWTKQP